MLDLTQEVTGNGVVSAEELSQQLRERGYAVVPDENDKLLSYVYSEGRLVGHVFGREYGLVENDRYQITCRCCGTLGDIVTKAELPYVSDEYCIHCTPEREEEECT